MEETHISFGGEVTFFLFVVGPLGPPPSLARFASLESPSKCPFSTKQKRTVMWCRDQGLASGPRPETVTSE